jgi:hypothetical protein
MSTNLIITLISFSLLIIFVIMYKINQYNNLENYNDINKIKN